MDYEEISSFDYTPILDGVEVIKLLYKTKESKLWLCKFEGKLYILKGKKKNQLSNQEIEFIKRERNFLEFNREAGYKNYPHFIKALKDLEYVYMILNFFQGATLSVLLQENIFKFNKIEDENLFILKKNLILSIISQIVGLIDNLHQIGYIHRDIKLNNIIIDEFFRISLIDFGYVKLINDDRTNTICGTYHTMAPEILSIRLNLTLDYDKKVDVYSLGVLIYELFKGSPPFPYVFHSDENILNDLYKQVSQGLNENHFNNNFLEINSSNTYLNSFFNNLKDLIENCMSKSELRPNIFEIKKHKIFENNFEGYKNFNFEMNIDYYKLILESIKFNGDFMEDYKFQKQDIFDEFF